MKNSTLILALFALLCIAAPFAHAAPLTLDTLEHWSGSGASRAALVVDWHDGTRPHSLAWGFRFDGAATALDLWNAVTAADTNLTGAISISGDAASGIAYRRPTRAGDILPATGNHEDVRKTAYSFDHTNAAATAGAWTFWHAPASAAPASDAFDAANFTLVPTADLASITIADGDWFALSRGDDPAAPIPPAHPAAALHYPFATEVVSYIQGGNVVSDYLARPQQFFNNPRTALGRPTVDTTGDGTIPVNTIVPVVPLYPAFRSYEMVSLGVSAGDGELVLAFDHPVYDNPDNPYGMDFIVFGNAFQVIGGGAYWRNGDPNLTFNGGTAFVEGGDVEVSQDGLNWLPISFINTDSPEDSRLADSFAPTLGRVYDTNNIDTALGAANKWWGGATDPTIPVDPEIIASDLNGMSLAQISRLYRGSAGGTAFDIGGLSSLEPDLATGMKWIRYVRITPDGFISPEIDAIADVSPALPIDLWRNINFAWLADPIHETDLADADADALPNLMEYALARDPLAPDAAPPFDTERTPAGFRFTHNINPSAPDVAAEMVQTSDLLAPDWNTNGMSAARSPDGQGITTEAPFDAAAGFMRLRVKYQE